MIRINLSGAPRTKKGKRAAVAMPSGGGGEGGGSGVLVGVVVFALILGANGYYWWSLNGQQAKLTRDLNAAKLEGQRLALVKTKYDQLQAKRDNVKKRVDIIDQLRAAQSGPVDLLTRVSDTVNQTDAVWLSSMQDQGSTVSIDGNALSQHAIASLMTNLVKTGNFKTVEIKESYQDDQQKEMQVFIFTLVCEKNQPSQKS